MNKYGFSLGVLISFDKHENPCLTDVRFYKDHSLTIKQLEAVRQQVNEKIDEEIKKLSVT